MAGERRFASIVAKRLESLGALTHGDRRATETRDLSHFNIDDEYGKKALDAVMKAIVSFEAPVIPPPEDYQGEFFKGDFCYFLTTAVLNFLMKFRCIYFYIDVPMALVGVGIT